MTALLTRLLVKNHTDVQAPRVRRAYGTMVSIVNMLTNVLLFAAKFTVGTLSGSVSITADAVNNLSDAGSQIISFISFRISAKPADREHPFGHARIEYVASMTVAFLVLFIGCELLGSSASTLYHSIFLPETVTEIGRAAFSSCENVKTITIPKTVTNIGEEAFYNCTSLKELVIPEKVTMIGQGAFRLETSMTSLRFESPLGWRSTNSANDWKNLTNGELIDLSNETNNVSNLNVYGLYLYKTTDNV